MDDGDKGGEKRARGGGVGGGARQNILFPLGLLCGLEGSS